MLHGWLFCIQQNPGIQCNQSFYTSISLNVLYYWKLLFLIFFFISDAIFMVYICISVHKAVLKYASDWKIFWRD